MDSKMTMAKDVEEIRTQVRAILPQIVSIRHTLHEHPEIGLKEFGTAKLAAQKLREFGADEVIEGVGGTGVVALIHGKLGASKRCVLFRGDMDALPLTEVTGCPWQSQNPGLMHACGHDGHTSWALAVAYALAHTRNFPGTAMVVIQPGEEGWAGGRKMIEDGLFTRWSVNEVYAGHGAPELPVGHYGLTKGACTSVADLFRIDVVGQGGHGARPHKVIDPVVASAQLVMALQTVVSRSIDPMHPAVITIASIHAGSEDGVSVIPNSVRLAGTVRCLYKADQERMIERMNEICEGVGLTTGTKVKLDYVKMYPSLVNAEPQRLAAGAVFAEIAGADKVEMEFPASMGAEDFSFMCEQKPGVYVRVGVRDAKHQASLHNPGFDFNDAVLEETATAFATLIERRLQALAKEP